MVFKKKKKAAKKEEAVTEEMQEATDEEPDAPKPQEEELTPEQLKAREIAQTFIDEYDGVIQFGTDGVRANLLFAVYAEQRQTNELLQELIKIVEEGNE